MSLRPQDRKYGVYTVDNQEFLFKKDAFDYAKHDKLKIKWPCKNPYLSIRDKFANIDYLKKIIDL